MKTLHEVIDYAARAAIKAGTREVEVVYTVKQTQYGLWVRDLLALVYSASHRSPNHCRDYPL